MMGRLLSFFLCVALLNSGWAQKAKFITPDNGASIKILKHKVGSGFFSIWGGDLGVSLNLAAADEVNSQRIEAIDTVFVGIDSGYYKSINEEMLVMIQKNGFRMRTQLVSLDQVRAAKKRILLEKLLPLPVHKKEDAYVIVDKVAFKVKKKDITQKSYESFTDFLNGKPERVEYPEKDIQIENTIFDDSLNNFLIRTQYIDTTHKLNLNIFDEIKLQITVNSITEHRYSLYSQMELRSTIKFESFFGDKHEVQKEYVTRSDVSYGLQPKRDLARALENLLIRLLEDPELSRNFKNPGKELKKLNDSLQEIIINNKTPEPTNLENATNAVVTVLVHEGHGSGCVISNNGYIVTNYHVAGIDTANMYAVFNSGARKRCRFIRGSAIYDLALLQVDTATSSPIKINTSKSIAVGADVYAIGTPKNIDLGQSITKGIISAKRNIESKIYIQSDVSVNSGNSGGAMTNKEGELIGIVNAKLVGYGVEGVSFAIPAYYIEEFLRLKIVR